jgi:hypothetical protein
VSLKIQTQPSSVKDLIGKDQSSNNLFPEGNVLSKSRRPDNKNQDVFGSVQILLPLISNEQITYI